MGRDWQLESLTGIAARRVFNTRHDTIQIDLFDDWSGGTFEIAEPRLEINIENSIGLPMKARVQTAWIETVTGEKILFETSVPDAAFALNYPSVNQMGSSVNTTFIFDQNNSNFPDLLNARPVSFAYILEYIFNPDDITDPGFISADSKISADMDLEIPAVGSVNDFIFENEAI